MSHFGSCQTCWFAYSKMACICLVNPNASQLPPCRNMFQLILGMIPCCFQDQTTTLSQQFCTDTAQILHVIRFEVRADNDVGLCKNDSSPKFGDVDRELRVSNSNVILFGMSHSQLPQPHAPHGRLWMLLPCRFRGHKIPI